MSVFVGITTCNRREVAEETINAWTSKLPAGAVLCVVDDASDVPFVSNDSRVKVVRNERRMGVAVSKNRAIEEFMKSGLDHGFMADDDTYPIANDWWQPYVNSPLPHLSYNWPHKIRRSKNGTGWPPRIIESDDQHDYYSFPRGVLLYVTRECVERVGGMNPAHGKFSGEHVEYSGRIKDVYGMPGFADVKGANTLWYARDLHEGNTRGSSFPLDERRKLHAANGAQYGRKWAGWPMLPIGEPFQDLGRGPCFGNVVEHCDAVSLDGAHIAASLDDLDSLSVGDFVVLDEVLEAEFRSHRWRGMSFVAVGHDNHHWAIRIM